MAQCRAECFTNLEKPAFEAAAERGGQTRPKLAETPRARDSGFIPLVTLTSQIVGTHLCGALNVPPLALQNHCQRNGGHSERRIRPHPVPVNAALQARVEGAPR
ncbi:hypothetical protein KCP78_24335 [Salmonella enterica subsp. enterica]|nr:hypothetical protein KCP78_24335 [Salmonella enterica subsp. enterica]